MENRDPIIAYMEDNNKEIACICKTDHNMNEYNHVFFFVDKGCKNPDYDADDLQIMKMEDVSIWMSTFEEARRYGYQSLESFYNYREAI